MPQHHLPKLKLFFDSLLAPTAWFCSNDLLALKLVNTLKRKHQLFQKWYQYSDFDWHGARTNSFTTFVLRFKFSSHHLVLYCGGFIYSKQASNKTNRRLNKQVRLSTHFVGNHGWCQPPKQCDVFFINSRKSLMRSLKR